MIPTYVFHITSIPNLIESTKKVDKYLALLEKTTPIIPPSHYFVKDDDDNDDEEEEEGGRFIPTSTSLFTNPNTNTNTNTSTQEEADLIALLYDETTLESTITERDDDDEEKGMEEISRRMKALGSVSNSSITTRGEGKKNDEGLLVQRPVISDLEVFDLIRDRDDEDVESDSEASVDSSSSSSSSS
jgi:hypothetical protein